jgi:hypothetical protein
MCLHKLCSERMVFLCGTCLAGTAGMRPVEQCQTPNDVEAMFPSAMGACRFYRALELAFDRANPSGIRGKTCVRRQTL